jgi:glyoxylase-like metal-dependent hydrolase (beta-lactamase superfamily II)
MLDHLFDQAAKSASPKPGIRPASNRRAFLTAGCLCACFLASPVLAAAPMARIRAPAFHRFMLGEFEITALSDGTNMLPATSLLQGDPARIAGALRTADLGEVVETSHNSYLVNTGSKLVLVDAGAGTLLGPTTGHLVANLTASGYRPDQVDEVYLTHLHADHIGGLLTDGKLTFPNAAVRADKHDVDFWLDDAEKRAAPQAMKRFFESAAVSLAPYQRANKLLTFDGDTDLVPGIRARAAYGHTPGHTMFHIASGAEQLLLWGDIVHVAAVQFADPSVTIGYDVLPTAARQVHEALFAETARERLMIGGAHISFPGLGHVRALESGGFAYEPVIYTQKASKG